MAITQQQFPAETTEIGKMVRTFIHTPSAGALPLRNRAVHRAAAPSGPPRMSSAADSSASSATTRSSRRRSAGWDTASVRIWKIAVENVLSAAVATFYFVGAVLALDGIAALCRVVRLCG
jgi:hypothetical protein